jgi:bifunctional DNA-binding transcriptional regulator/antitoxin component of YhaV-PrlF toxin-antitoxin module
MRSPQTRGREGERNIVNTESGFRRITSKGQITIPQTMRRRYNITMQTKLEFVPSSEGILLRPAPEEGSFKELAGSASKNWTVDEMLKRLNELRKENV